MEEITNETPLILFDHGKKLPIEGLSALDANLLPQDFLTPADSPHPNTTDGATAPFSNSLLILHNDDLAVERPITLDDVVEFDLSSLTQTLATQENQPEQLGFNTYLSETPKFTLNDISSDKIADVPEKATLSFDDFEALSVTQSSTPCNRDGGISGGSKMFKILPTFADGKLTNTLHIPDSGEELANGITVKILPSVPELPTVDVSTDGFSDVGKISSFVSDFPQITVKHLPEAMISDQPNDNIKLCDLITVCPKNPANKVTETKLQTEQKTAKSSKVKKKVKAKNDGSECLKKPSETSIKKRKAKKRKAPSPSDDATPVRLIAETKTATIPKINIVMKPDFISSAAKSEISQQSNSGSTVTAPEVKAVESNGRQAASMPILNIAKDFDKCSEPPTVDLILPLSLNERGNSKVVFKPISELKPEDIVTVQKNPLKKLSKIQVQQIINLVKQQESTKNLKSDQGLIGRNENSKIICKVMYPEEFLGDANLSKGQPAQVTNKNGNAIVSKAKPHGTNKKAKGRLKRDGDFSEDCTDEESLPSIPVVTSVTRSGRTSRPPKKLVKLKNRAVPNKVNSTPSVSDTTAAPTETVNNLPPTQTESDKPPPQKLEGATNSLFQGLDSAEPQKKKTIPSYMCPGCPKKYLFKRFLLEHLEKFPDHADAEFTSKIHQEIMNELNNKRIIELNHPEKKKRTCKCKCKNRQNCRVLKQSFAQMANAVSYDDLIKSCVPRLVKNMSVWDFLLHKIKALHKNEQVKGFLDELGNLFESALSVSPKILYQVNQSTESTVEIRDDLMCHVLGVSKGVYQTFPDGLENKSSPSLELPNGLFFDKEPNLPSELDIGAQPDTKEDLSQSSVLSEFLCDKTGMDTVDQLVQERLKTLAPHSDDSSLLTSDDLNSLLETVNSQHGLNETASMFNLRSGSAEDFLKALDTLSSEIQPDPPDPTPPEHSSHPEPPLDFTALSENFPTVE